MEARKIKMPLEVANELGVSIDAINSKLQAILDRKKGMSLEEIVSANVLDDYRDFTREEMQALYMDAAAEAGFYRFKLDLLVQAGAVDEEIFTQIMEQGIDKDEDDLNGMLGFPSDFL